MSVTINASTSSGLVQTADTSGIIELQSNGTTVATVNSTGLTANTTTKAWVRFNGTAATVNASYNVSSVTRASAGLYTVNFTNAISDANYAFLISGASSGNAPSYYSTSTLAGSFGVGLLNIAGGGIITFADSLNVSVAIFR
jgi:hypothetical protein